MRAGTLRNRLTLQTRTETRDAMGDSTPTWTSGTTLWAKVEEKGGGEQLDGKQVDGQRTVNVTIRYLATIDPSQRFLHDGTPLNIVSINDPDGTRRMLEIVCRRDD